jgi:hypothetical protein
MDLDTVEDAIILICKGVQDKMSQRTTHRESPLYLKLDDEPSYIRGYFTPNCLQPTSNGISETVDYDQVILVNTD